jgi:hypothetical protein
MLFCIDCGCSQQEGKYQRCLGGKPYHRYQSTEARGSQFGKHHSGYNT